MIYHVCQLKSLLRMATIWKYTDWEDASMLTVLLTDGAFTGLIRTLRAAYSENIRIVGLSTSSDTPHQALLDAFYIVSPHNDAGYIDALIQILHKEKVDVVFPIESEGLESLMQSENRILSETGARILSAPVSSLITANDKGLLYSFLADSPDYSLSSLAPLFYFADTKASLFEAIHAIQNTGRKACIKKRRGEDAEGFWLIDNDADYSSRLFTQPPGRSLTERMLSEMLSKMDDREPIPPYLVSEYLPGEEWDCDVLCMHGKLLSVTTRINLRMTGGLTSLLEVRDHPYLAACCEKITAALGLSYVACISFRADASGRFFLLEINPRMMGNIYVSALAGNNYAEMAIDLLYGREIHTVPPKSGIRTALYYDQLIIETNMQNKENEETHV